MAQADNFDPKAVYDPRDPHIYRRFYAQILTQTIAAKLHQQWCEWAMSMIDQGYIVSTEVENLMKLFVPFQNLNPEDQHNHMVRADQIVSEFLNWKLVDQSLKKGGPKRGASNV
jgi:hypothetical protein